MTEFTWTDPRIPEPEHRFFFVRCPRCGYRVWNQLFSQAIAYQAHYLGHIRADLEAAAEVPQVIVKFHGDLTPEQATWLRERFRALGRRIR